MREEDYWRSLLRELVKLPTETPWLELKTNNRDPQQIGEYISALANAAALARRSSGYLIWGIDDASHDLLGTDFDPAKTRKGAEELESWLLRLLTPKVNFRFVSISTNGKKFVLLEVDAASHNPVQFGGTEYVRIGSYKKKLKDFPEKEKELWRIFDETPFEQQVAMGQVSSEWVISQLSHPLYFELTGLMIPELRSDILNYFESERFIAKDLNGQWNILNLGALLFARELHSFSGLARKVVRVVVYRGNNKLETIQEWNLTKGYAHGFQSLIEFIENRIILSETIESGIRKTLYRFPRLAVRELVANALIHQEFNITGTGPIVEIFDNRIEITNPGLPCIPVNRFVDSPPQSRNERLASFMRRIGICEERGSGIDKVVLETEHQKLPPPLFEVTEQHTTCVLFAYREFKAMDRQERMRACHLHACIKFVDSPQCQDSCRT